MKGYSLSRATGYLRDRIYLFSNDNLTSTHIDRGNLVSVLARLSIWKEPSLRNNAFAFRLKHQLVPSCSNRVHMQHLPTYYPHAIPYRIERSN